MTEDAGRMPSSGAGQWTDFGRFSDKDFNGSGGP
jgi:hypothetical protein